MDLTHMKKKKEEKEADRCGRHLDLNCTQG